jgi:hypothetical protein
VTPAVTVLLLASAQGFRWAVLPVVLVYRLSSDCSSWHVQGRWAAVGDQHWVATALWSWHFGLDAYVAYLSLMVMLCW